LAAALEYEEVLKQKLPAEQWGWTAIHLCNLYSSKLNQPDKAIALLRRIDSDFGATSAAEKARQHLDIQEDKAVSAEVMVEELPVPEPTPPPMKAPENPDLQMRFDKFHQGATPSKENRH
jgi:hypothetical protein